MRVITKLLFWFVVGAALAAALPAFAAAPPGPVATAITGAGNTIAGAIDRRPTPADVRAAAAVIAAQLARQAAAQEATANEFQRVKNLSTDFPPGGGGGGLTPGFLGPTCKAARVRMRWSSMPCAWDQPRGYGDGEVDPETSQ